MGRLAPNRPRPWVMRPFCLVCEGGLAEGALASVSGLVLVAGCSRDRGSGRAQAE